MFSFWFIKYDHVNKSRNLNDNTFMFVWNTDLLINYFVLYNFRTNKIFTFMVAISMGKRDVDGEEVDGEKDDKKNNNI